MERSPQERLEWEALLDHMIEIARKAKHEIAIKKLQKALRGLEIEELKKIRKKMEGTKVEAIDDAIKNKSEIYTAVDLCLWALTLCDQEIDFQKALNASAMWYFLDTDFDYDYSFQARMIGICLDNESKEQRKQRFTNLVKEANGAASILEPSSVPEPNGYGYGYGYGYGVVVTETKNAMQLSDEKLSGLIDKVLENTTKSMVLFQYYKSLLQLMFDKGLVQIPLRNQAPGVGLGLVKDKVIKQQIYWVPKTPATLNQEKTALDFARDLCVRAQDLKIEFETALEASAFWYYLDTKINQDLYQKHMSKLPVENTELFIKLVREATRAASLLSGPSEIVNNKELLLETNLGILDQQLSGLFNADFEKYLNDFPDVNKKYPMATYEEYSKKFGGILDTNYSGLIDVFKNKTKSRAEFHTDKSMLRSRFRQVHVQKPLAPNDRARTLAIEFPGMCHMNDNAIINFFHSEFGVDVEINEYYSCKPNDVKMILLKTAEDVDKVMGQEESRIIDIGQKLVVTLKRLL